MLEEMLPDVVIEGLRDYADEVIFVTRSSDTAAIRCIRLQFVFSPRDGNLTSPVSRSLIQARLVLKLGVAVCRVHWRLSRR